MENELIVTLGQILLGSSVIGSLIGAFLSRKKVNAEANNVIVSAANTVVAILEKDLLRLQKKVERLEIINKEQEQRFIDLDNKFNVLTIKKNELEQRFQELVITNLEQEKKIKALEEKNYRLEQRCKHLEEENAKLKAI